MNRDHHDPAELNDFETRLKSLAPRPPLAAAALVAAPDESKQVAAGRRWWSVEIETPYAFYRTVGLSASVGALAGVACTLLIVSWIAVPTQYPTPSVAVATDDVPPGEVALSNVAPNNAVSSNVAGVTEHNQESAGVADSGSSSAHVEPHLQVTSVRRSMNENFPGDWLHELRRLKPGTLGVGTRLVSQQSARLGAANKESMFEASGPIGDEPSETIVEISAGSSRIDLNSAPVPQRQWMHQMLTSPNEFY